MDKRTKRKTKTKTSGEKIKWLKKKQQYRLIKTEVTKKVAVELEVDTSIKDLGPNPYAKLIHLARAVDQWRIFPRLFLSVYIYLLYKVTIWFMNLPTPTFEQSGLVSIVVGAGAAWFGLYAGTSKGKK